MKKSKSNFLSDESGAISADWVVITAAMVIFAAAITATVKTSAIAAGEQIGTEVAEMATE